MPLSLRLFGALHSGMILFVLFLIFLVQYLGKRMEKKGSLEQFSRQLGFCMLGVWLLYILYNFSPARFSWEKSLPLEVCDMLALAAIFTLLTEIRISRSLLYFSAFLLTGQAIITPVGDQNPAHLRFWLYWVFHAGIIAIAFLDVRIRRYRPLFRDLILAWQVNLLYLLTMGTLDYLFSWNYGFIGNITPEAPTLLDYLGPWPARVFIMFSALCLAQWLIMYRPAKGSGNRQRSP